MYVAIEAAHVYPRAARGEPVSGFVRVDDATGRADVRAANEAWRRVTEGYAALGVRLRRPVSLVIERMPIMGATQTTGDGHRLHVAAHAVASGMLDGLMAHEMGHMVLTERGHPSHRPDLHERILAAINIPAARTEAFGNVAAEAINHVEDVYADDLAIRVIGDDARMAAFFSEWVRNSARDGGSRWRTVANGVTVAFALGNLARHGIPPDDGAEDVAAAFAREADVPSLMRFMAGFRDLPTTDETEPVEAAMRDLLTAIASEGAPPRARAGRP